MREPFNLTIPDGNFRSSEECAGIPLQIPGFAYSYRVTVFRSTDLLSILGVVGQFDVEAALCRQVAR